MTNGLQNPVHTMQFEINRRNYNVKGLNSPVLEFWEHRLRDKLYGGFRTLQFVRLPKKPAEILHYADKQTSPFADVEIPKE